jgi:hypothetical protein
LAGFEVITEGIEFRVGGRELGHVHETIADLPFPRRIRDELIAEE